MRINPDNITFKKEVVVSINRVTKVVSGGKRFSFSALIVLGDGAGHVGAGLGKAKEVQGAIAKGVASAKNSLIYVPLQGTTLPHETLGAFGAGRVLMRPASEGTGLIAGGGVRAVLESAGVHDVLTKSLRSSNPFNVVYATLEGLKMLRLPQEVERMRGKTIAKPAALATSSPKKVEAGIIG